MLTWRNWTTVSLAWVLTSVLAACGANSEGDADAVTDSPRATPIAAVEVQPRDLSRQLVLSGMVQPRVAIRLASRTSGTVDRVTAEEGDWVEAGQLLVALDTREQRAELARAEAEAEEAELEYRRLAELRDSRLVSDTDYQRVRAALRVAESNRELWRARVDFGEVRSPVRAVVTARHVEPGEAVDAQDVLLELAALDELVIRLGVSELDVVYLEAGQSVDVTLDAFSGQSFAATIRRIFPAADGASRLVTVELALVGDAAERGVRPGYLGRVAMIIDRREAVLAVPAVAVGQEGSDNAGEGSGREHYVYVVVDGVLHHRRITPGVSRGQWVEVLEGLDKGDVVLATNPVDMREGQAVRIVGWRG